LSQNEVNTAYVSLGYSFRKLEIHFDFTMRRRIGTVAIHSQIKYLNSHVVLLELKCKSTENNGKVDVKVVILV